MAKPEGATDQHVTLLTAFIHDLIRDHLPVGKVERMVRDIEDKILNIRCDGTLPGAIETIDYENAHMEALAAKLAKRILGVP